MSISEKMKQDALEGQKLTRKFFVIELDFSRESLLDLEDLFDNVEIYLRGGKSEENIALLTRTWGAYLGEVLQRQGIGNWAKEADAIGGAVLTRDGEPLRPHAQVRQRLLEGDSANVVRYANSILDA